VSVVGHRRNADARCQTSDVRHILTKPFWKIPFIYPFENTRAKADSRLVTDVRFNNMTTSGNLSHVYGTETVPADHGSKSPLSVMERLQCIDVSCWFSCLFRVW
jgi:hypothetical protein